MEVRHHVSKRSETRRRQRQQQTQQRFIVIGILLAAAVAVGALVAVNLTNDDGDVQITTVDSVSPEGADGKAVGPADAEVVIVEYSDFS